MANASGYANSVFHAARQDPDGYPARHCEPSWSDQTDWAVKWANEAIEDAELRAAIDDEVELLSSARAPSLDGFARADIATVVSLGGTELRFSPQHGAIIGLKDTRGQEWARPSSPLALFEYVLFTNAQMTALRAEYCPSGCNPKEFGKPGMPLNTSVNATPSAPSLWLKRTAGGGTTEVITMATMEASLNRDYGAPAQVWLHLTGGGDNISISMTLLNKTATRFAEAGFVTFAPAQTDHGGWAMDKLGRWVSPLHVADGGSMGMSPLNTGILYSRGAREASAFFRTLDSAVAKFGEKLPFPTPIHGRADMSRGTHFLLFDNYCKPPHRAPVALAWRDCSFWSEGCGRQGTPTTFSGGRTAPGRAPTRTTRCSASRSSCSHRGARAGDVSYWRPVRRWVSTEWVAGLHAAPTSRPL